MGGGQKERERKEREERERREREEERKRQRQLEAERQRLRQIEKERIEAEIKRIEAERAKRERERKERERERERKEQERRERERRERERKERERREREQQFKREEEITRNIETNIKNLRNKINSFKSNFEDNYYNAKENYKIFFKELKDLLEKVENRSINWNINYPYEEKKYIHRKAINNEINNFNKFLYEKIYKIIDNLGKNRKFSECLESIKELENNFSLNEIDFLNYQKEDYKKKLETIKIHCVLMLKRNKSKEIFNQDNYDESIKLIKELYYNSSTDVERELYSKEIKK